jgi:uncharacterized LabA/DUF88 family protein
VYQENILQKIAVFIDGASVYATGKTLGWDVDYKKLRNFLAQKYSATSVTYYSRVLENEEYNSIQPLLDWLNYNGYRVVTKPTRSFEDPVTGERKTTKLSMNIPIIIDMFEQVPHLDEIIIFSGDGELSDAVSAVQRKGVRVSIVSSLATTPPSVSDSLRRQADEFIELNGLRPEIAKDEQDRFARQSRVPKDRS